MIKIIKVANKDEGNFKAHDLLKEMVDDKTLLGLSGGTTPDYKKMIIDPGDILPGAAFIVDERWTDDNESTNLGAMNKIKLNSFFKTKGVDFYGVPLKSTVSGCGEDCGDSGDCDSDSCDSDCEGCDCSCDVSGVVKGFDHLLRDLFKKYPKKVGIMGIGANAHTAGIFPGSNAVKSKELVSFDEMDDKYPERITVTLEALSKFDSFVILAFGEEKRKALSVIFDKTQNDAGKYPDIFFRKSTAESFLITDIDVK